LDEDEERRGKQKQHNFFVASKYCTCSSDKSVLANTHTQRNTATQCVKTDMGMSGNSQHTA
jgi:hypothetical protein